MCRQELDRGHIEGTLDRITNGWKRFVEIRVLGLKEYKQHNGNVSTFDSKKFIIYSGFFNNIENVMVELSNVVSAKGIYYAINPVSKETVKYKYSGNINRLERGQATKTDDVESRGYVLIDIDSNREGDESKIPTTDEQHKHSQKVLYRVNEYLIKKGWKEPLVSSSGNGYHALYKVDMPVEDTTTIKNLLKSLNEKFGDEKSKIDTVVHDLPRICRLPGTRNCKDLDTEEDEKSEFINHGRIHRMAFALSCPKVLEITDIDTIKKCITVKEEIKKEKGKQSVNVVVNTEAQDSSVKEITDWLKENDVKFKTPTDKGDFIVIGLYFCLLEDDHKASYNSSFLIMKSGAKTYKCQGERCNERKWEDFKEAYRYKKTTPVDFEWDKPIYSKGISVKKLDPNCLPELYSECCKEISKDTCVPLDFPATALYIATAGIIGRRFSCQVKHYDPRWKEYPTLFGGVVGPPSARKTPGTKPILDIVREVDKYNKKEYETKMKGYKSKAETLELLKKKVINDIKKSDDDNEIDKLQKQKEAFEDKIEKLKPVRDKVALTEATVEGLTQIMQESKFGNLIYQDELYGFFQMLKKSGHEGDRQFYLNVWNGDGYYDNNTVGRGQTEVDGLCASIFGTIQPSRINSLLQDVVVNGDDDGMMARFALLVWPDKVEKKWVDEAPNEEIYKKIRHIFFKINAFKPVHPNGDPKPEAIRFSKKAYDINVKWQEGMDSRVDEGFEIPGLDSLFGKNTGLLPKIALINYIVDRFQGVDTGYIEEEHINKAVKYLDYLDSHAYRTYTNNGTQVSSGSKTLLDKIYEGKVNRKFKAAEVYNSGWKYLSGIGSKKNSEVCKKVFDELVNNEWIQEHKEGRKKWYYVHPEFDKYYKELVLNAGRTEKTKRTKSWIEPEDTKPEEVQNKVLLVNKVQPESEEPDLSSFEEEEQYYKNVYEEQEEEELDLV